ncbi:MAG: primosomal protein N' [Oscillospiraceae bacterium]|nr:primosomal protein N' [Oscillospiraceae bacterium]
MLAMIALSGVPYPVDKLYTYLVPREFSAQVFAGKRVIVPFGKANRRTEGMVFSVTEGETEEQLKPILSVPDEQVLMNEEMLRLAKWMKARYFCTFYDAVKTILPAGIWHRYREIYSLAEGVSADASLSDETLGSEEKAVLMALAEAGEMDADTLRSGCPEATASILNKLAAQGLICVETRAEQRISDRQQRLVQLAVNAEDALAVVEKKRSSAPVRYAVIDLLAREGILSTGDLSYYTGASMQTLRGLEKSGLIAFHTEEVLRIPVYSNVPSGEPIVLNDAQQVVYDELLEQLKRKFAGVSLLHGVTASGKTQVYIRLIQDVLALGRNAMVLVPEIALTPQIMAKFTAYFGDQVAMLHSALPLSERYDQFKRIRRGEVCVVLGTRSAVFAPLENIGLIVMDEEQEGSYQSENPPRYHTRDIAQLRCAEHGAMLLLGSATPTIESMYYAKTGRYKAFSLYRRFNEKALPKVLIADMRQELRRGNEGSISETLRCELQENLARGEQSILFLNRRGNSRMLLCGECGDVPECPRCSVPMTYHSANGRLMCHYCGHSERAETHCSVCGGLRKSVGTGTQKVEEELKTLFPQTEILRMDADTVGAGRGHEKLLKKFEKENIPILLGTQMVAKGLDFENVTLVGVLAADLALYIDHFRAAERTFSLLTQVVGRAGRGERQGRAVIQTFTPENDVIRAAAAQDYEAFYENEIRMRRLRRYPPFADLFTFTVSGGEEGQVLRAAAALRRALDTAVLQPGIKELGVEVLGPVGAPVIKVNNRYRYRVYLVGENCAALRRLVSEYIHAFYRHKENRGLDIFADCNAIQ